MNRFKNLRTNVFVFLLTVCGLATVAALSAIGQPPAVVYSAAGATAASIQPVVDAFRAAIGGVNNGNAIGPLSGGRREINWDGGGAAALATNFASPMTNFNTAVPRGAVFLNTDSGFEISGAPSPRFGEINPTYPAIFTTFSAPRLFSPRGGTTTDTRFFIPGTNTPSTVSAFGAVFTDVDLADTSIEYFNILGESIGKVFVPPSNNGLSFAAVIFANVRIAGVRIKSGTAALGPDDSPSADVVVMDDFIYSEPTTIGPPTNGEQCKNNGWKAFNFPPFNNQGDCMQFVNTGK